jgi:hypothetical protein
VPRSGGDAPLPVTATKAGEEHMPADERPAHAEREVMFSHLFASKPAKDAGVLGAAVTSLIFHAVFLALAAWATLGSGEEEGEQVTFLWVLEDAALSDLQLPGASRDATPSGAPDSPSGSRAQPGAEGEAGVTDSGVTAGEGGEPGASGAGLTAAARLRPRVGDWRLWFVPPVPSRRDLTPAERAEEVRYRLYMTLRAFNDSMAAQLAREAAAMDWTVGEEGNKWGVSPGQIHLGGLTLPLPFYFGPTREQMEQMGEWSEIQRQAGQAEIDETVDERIRAIRERRAQEAARNNPPPDTTKGL